MQYRILAVVVAALALTLFVGVASAADETHEGLIVLAQAGKLTMTDKDGKNEHTHAVAQNAQITLDGKQCRLEDLRKGFRVTVTTSKQGDKEVAIKIDAKKAP